MSASSWDTFQTDWNSYSPQQIDTAGMYGLQSQDQSAALSGAQNAQQNIANLQSQSQSLAGLDGSEYPSMPNSYGLGAQVNGSSDSGQDQSANTAISSSSRGFNPWSLTGEAMSR